MKVFTNIRESKKIKRIQRFLWKCIVYSFWYLGVITLFYSIVAILFPLSYEIILRSIPLGEQYMKEDIFFLSAAPLIFTAAFYTWGYVTLIKKSLGFVKKFTCLNRGCKKESNSQQNVVTE